MGWSGSDGVHYYDYGWHRLSTLTEHRIAWLFTHLDKNITRTGKVESLP